MIIFAVFVITVISAGHVMLADSVKPAIGCSLSAHSVPDSSYRTQAAIVNGVSVLLPVSR